MHACFYPFLTCHEVLPDIMLGTGHYHIVNHIVNRKETDYVELKSLHSDCSLLPEWKRKMGNESRKIFFLGFGFRDGQNLWPNFYFVFMDKLVPECAVQSFQFTKGQNKMLEDKSSHLFWNWPEFEIIYFHL